MSSLSEASSVPSPPSTRGTFESAQVKNPTIQATLSLSTPHHTDQRIGQCSDDLGAPRYHPSLSLTPASPLWSPARPRRGPPGGQHERCPDEEAHCSEERSCVGQRKVDQSIRTRQHKARDRRRHESHRTQQVEPRDRPGQLSQLRTPEPDSQGRNRVRAGHEKQNRAEEVRAPDVLVGLCRGEVVYGRRKRADVEEERPGELRGCSQPVLVARPPSPQQGLDAGVLALFVDACHPWALRLYQLAVRRRRKEDRSDEEGHGVCVRSDRVYICGDSRVQASWFCAHVNSELRGRHARSESGCRL